MKKKQKMLSFEEWEKRKLKNPEFKKLAKMADDDLFIAVALQLVEARKKKHLSQSQLAKKAKTSQEAISRMESLDYRGYTLSALEKVFGALDMKLHINVV